MRGSHVVWRLGSSGTQEHQVGLKARLDLLIRQAGTVMAWERLWPAIALILSIFGLFLAVSWAGLWMISPPWLRISGVAVFGLLLAGALLNLARLKWPDRRESLARLDRDSGFRHRPASTLDDRLANDGDDQATRALWGLHLSRTEKDVSGIRLRSPAPRLVERDRYALRASILLALVATAFVAGPEKYPRVLAAFDWREAPSATQTFRLDAWIDPPPYTGRPPVVLNVGGEKAQADKTPIRAPAGSIVIVRASNGSGITPNVSGGLQRATDDTAAGAKPGSTEESRYTLRDNGRLTLKRASTIVSEFEIVSIPDQPPKISLRGEPKSSSRGALTLGYAVQDDYGIIGAEATFEKPMINGRVVAGRSLVEPPKMILSLPASPGGLGEGETTGDLSEHPWAGARVTMKLVARDEGGNEGQSEPFELTLPQRAFVKPLARALVEQRRNLILAPDDRRRVQLAMDTLIFAPEEFSIPGGIYLGLRTISQRLRLAQSDSDLISVAELMWEMALRLEDGDLSQAERDLRAAQQQLREALDRGATPEELKRLMDQLRAALDKFVQELAEQMLRDRPNAERQQDPNDRTLTITPRDLQALLDRMEEMARNGNTADAQRMLDQLQRLMENLQNAQRRNQQNQMSREMNRALSELDRLTREQQQLRDETFQDRQRQNRRGPNGEEADEEGQSAEGQQQRQQDLQRRQEALRQRLEDLQRRMKQFGMKGEQGFEEAEGAMRDAEQGLAEGNPSGNDRAVDSQGRALEALRKGAQSMAQQMQQQGQQGEGQAGPGPGPGEPNGPMREGRNTADPDPLGRESRDRTYNPQSRYDPLGAPASERAQRVLEELRKRLGDTSRPREEIDYLERLLRRY
jgi:uncharacterized protein (TIGR02302 family)